VRATDRVPIVVFLTSFDAGGTERQMTELVRRLDRARFDVHVACFHRRGPWLGRIEAAVDEVAEFPIRSFRSPATALAALSFARWCRSRRIAVMQAADLYANAFALPAARLAAVPVRIGSRREVHPTRGKSLELLQRFGYSAAHRIVANSDAGAACLQREGIAAGRISVVRNGLDLDQPAGGPPRRRGFRLITVARLRPEKGHEVLLAALARVRREVPEVRLQIVGDGPRETTLREMVRREALGDCVEFLGHRDDVASLLRQADCFVLPSRIEAAPNAVLEAMAAGLPVVATRVGGIPEVVTDGVTGLLVAPDNPDALAAALLRLLNDAALAGRVAHAGRQHVVAHYSFARMVAQFESLYFAELERRRYPLPRLAEDGVQPAAS
jgi:glycosyltransferase involved in cell wall biosynthesis